MVPSDKVGGDFLSRELVPSGWSTATEFVEIGGRNWAESFSKMKLNITTAEIQQKYLATATTYQLLVPPPTKVSTTQHVQQAHDRHRGAREALPKGHTDASIAAAPLVQPTSGELLGGGLRGSGRQNCLGRRPQMGAKARKVRFTLSFKHDLHDSAVLQKG